MMKKELTLNDIAGNTTERTVWQLLLSLAGCGNGELSGVSPQRVVITENTFLLKAGQETSSAFAAPETFAGGGTPQESSEVWSIGALAFYASTGTNVFEGKGGETQTAETRIPRISSTHAGRDLSTLIWRCLSFSPNDRPTKSEIVHQAEEALHRPAVSRKRLTGMAGKSYERSLVTFWPEEMVPLLLMFLLLTSPGRLLAQEKTSFDRSAIPDEMVALVLRCQDLRSPQNMTKVSRAMDRDMNWTMMDELAVDKKGECTTKDVVDVFGLNDVGFSILKRHGGVTNAGGRFRDGRDPRYKYSLLEITVKKDLAVSYQVSGREGTQIFAVIPFEKNADFEASVPNGKVFKDNGVCYIQLQQKLKKEDAFTLTIRNKSGKNMAFALINYNSRNHE